MSADYLQERCSLFSEAFLSAHKTGWSLQFVFPGPDRRYNPTVRNISPSEVQRLIVEYPLAYEKYAKLKLMNDGGPELTTNYSTLAIKVGGLFDGVCMFGYRYPVRTPMAMKGRIKGLEMVCARGEHLVEMAKAL